MPTSSLRSPLFEFYPVYKNYLWGGQRIPERFRRSVPSFSHVAESWEIADHPDGMSRVRGGPWEGCPLRRLMEEEADALVGRPMGAFPLLIKILDAADTLSVQVHPDEEAARRLGGEPKTECWYVLETTPSAICRLGLKPGASPERIRTALASRDVAQWLQTLHPQPGDLLFVPAGRVHAIGAGCLFLELQQNSNTVYRLYDWDRVDPSTGQSRPLHVEAALAAIRWHDEAPLVAPPEPWTEKDAFRLRTRLSTPFFCIEEMEINGACVIEKAPDRFHILFDPHGSIRVETEEEARTLQPGSPLLVPAVTSRYRIFPHTGPSRILRIGPPA
jgi:mannose-6-phosphate isomerase